MGFKEVKEWYKKLGTYEKIAVVEELLACVYNEVDDNSETSNEVDVDDIIESLTNKAEQLDCETIRDKFYEEIRSKL